FFFNVLLFLISCHVMTQFYFVKWEFSHSGNEIPNPFSIAFLYTLYPQATSSVGSPPVILIITSLSDCLPCFCPVIISPILSIFLLSNFPLWISSNNCPDILQSRILSIPSG